LQTAATAWQARVTSTTSHYKAELFIRT